MQNYLRHNRLGTTGRYLVVRKRPFLGVCELCGKPIQSNPKWHHWDKDHPELGMWLDILCHGAAEAFEQNGIDVPAYRELKEIVINNLTL